VTLCGAEVTFTSPNPKLFPLPDPRYLAFHAALAKVIHMAGMVEHLDEILWKTEDIRVLSDETRYYHVQGLGALCVHFRLSTLRATTICSRHI